MMSLECTGSKPGRKDGTRYAVGMREMGVALAALLSISIVCPAASLSSCESGAAKYTPCELTFQWNKGEVPGEKSPYRDALLNVEFRGPDSTTYLIHSFWDGSTHLRVRFVPNQAGTWTYRVTSEIHRLDNKEATFSVSDTASAGYINVANVRHWRSDDKKPHLWLAAEAPWLEMDANSFRTWVDSRKQDGFTHIRGVVLTQESSQSHPLVVSSQPNFAYFEALDDRLLYAHSQGFTLDLILADHSFLQTGVLSRWADAEPLIRYVIARYGALNVTWQGIERFEEVGGSRTLLKQLFSSIDRLDTYHHPRSTDARDTSSVLARDGWETFIIEASANPQLAAVEHQITTVPQIHVIQSNEPDGFRHELWNATANGEYPSVSYVSLQNPANVQAVRVWSKIMTDVRHWEFEPVFDVDGARAVGLDNVEYILYADQPGTVEITFNEKHKYNPLWINPRTGEEIDLKDFRQDVYSVTTPQPAGDWILQLPREGHKASMAKSVRFESVDAPEQIVETNTTKVPFDIGKPAGDTITLSSGSPAYEAHLKRANRATRTMQYLWTGEIVANGDGPRVLGLGSSGTFAFLPQMMKGPQALLNVRVTAINANGKAYSFDKVYQLNQ